MGVKAVFDAVRALVIAARPDVEMEISAEAKEFHGTPPRVIWFYPEFPSEDHNMTHVTPGANISDAHEGLLYNRSVACQIHVWMAGEVNARGVEELDDNEDPSLGDVWLPAVIQNCIYEACSCGYGLGKAGMLPRTMGNSGFTYVFEVLLDFGIYRTKTRGSTTIQSFTLTGDLQ